jgi:hypothetical protein
VQTNVENFEVFERMHYVCFHYEFEHGEVDVDEDCSAGGCPSASMTEGRLTVIETAKELANDAASGAPWRNAETHEFLQAFAKWLADSDGFWLDERRVPPGNGWKAVNAALKAATTYES